MKAKVPLYRTNPTRAVLIDTEATQGAVVGVNLFNQDGSLYVPPSADAAAPGTGIALDDVQVLGPQSVTVTGSIAEGAVTVALDGDTAAPGNTYLYSTGLTGTKGWNALSSMLHQSANVAVTFAADGTATFDLQPLTDSGAGTFKLLTRDSYGRLSGTKDGTTSDVPEGENLYYTDARARDAVVAASIADGDTTHSPSGDAVHDALALKVDASQLGVANGVATLDANGDLDASQLPPLAVTTTYVVNTEAAMLALAADQGDVAVRTDLNESFILTASPASTLANWQELLTPTSPVTSVFGRTGSVVGASGDYTFAQIGSKPTTLSGYGITDAEPAITAGTTAQYWRGDKTWQTLNKSAVGLGNVDNTSDANKPVSTAQALALAGKADKGDVPTTTDDLAEGSVNLYFTGARVAASLAEGTGISLSTSAGVTTITATGSGSSGVDSFNGRTGSVTPATGDYTFAQISDTPTTLAGYGITDAATAAQGAKADSALQPHTSINPSSIVVGGTGVATDPLIYSASGNLWMRMNNSVYLGLYTDGHLTYNGQNIAKNGDSPTFGGASFTGGVSFGSSSVSTPTDVTRHIALYGTVYGLSITPATLNIVSNGSVGLAVKSDGIVIAGGKKLGKITVSSASPGTLADGELYLQY